MNDIQRVVIIGWDGAGNFVQAARTPNLDQVAARGAFEYEEATTELPSISAQCWGSLLHGIGPELHGRTNAIAASEPFPEDSPYPSIFRVVREAYPDAPLASYCAWAPINDGLIERELGVHKVSLPDRELGTAAAAYIRENPDFKLLLLVFDLPDAAGHRDGFKTAEQQLAIEETDGLTGEVLQALEDAGLTDSTLLILVSDHGGGGEDPRDHGSAHPQDMTIFWGCAGPGIVPSAGISGGVRIRDTAAVAVEALGLTPPDGWQSHSPDGLIRKA